jgi:hypothetical protein
MSSAFQATHRGGGISTGFETIRASVGSPGLNPTSKLRLTAPVFPSPLPNLPTLSERDILRGRAPGIERRKAWPCWVLRSLSIGHLCAELKTDAQAAGIGLEPGAGVIEFDCPVPLSCPAFTAFDAAIEEEGQPVSAQQRCATLHVSPGKLVSGYLYIKTRRVW